MIDLLEAKLESMLTWHASVTLQKGGATISATGGTLTDHCHKGTQIFAMDVLEYQNHTGPSHKVNRIRFMPVEGESSWNVIRYLVEA